LVEQREGGWSCDLISVPYEFGHMVALAERNHRPDWAHALRTGRMPRG
jgi:hypothetical protein